MDTLYEVLCTFMVSCWIRHRMRNVFDKRCRGTQNTLFCWVTFFSHRKLYHLWDNVEKYGRDGQATDDSVIRRMRVACWITKTADTLRICNMYCFSTTRMVARMGLSVRSVCIASLVYWHLVPQNGYEPHTLRRPFAGFFSHFLTLQVSV